MISASCVTRRSCAAPILKVDRHISDRFLPLFSNIDAESKSIVNGNLQRTLWRTYIFSVLSLFPIVCFVFFSAFVSTAQEFWRQTQRLFQWHVECSGHVFPACFCSCRLPAIFWFNVWSCPDNSLLEYYCIYCAIATDSLRQQAARSQTCHDQKNGKNTWTKRIVST